MCNIICEETKDGTESSLVSVHYLEGGRRMRKLGVVKWNVDDHFSVRI